MSELPKAYPLCRCGRLMDRYDELHKCYACLCGHRVTKFHALSRMEWSFRPSKVLLDADTFSEATPLRVVIPGLMTPEDVRELSAFVDRVFAQKVDALPDEPAIVEAPDAEHR